MLHLVATYSSDLIGIIAEGRHASTGSNRPRRIFDVKAGLPLDKCWKTIQNKFKSNFTQIQIKKLDPVWSSFWSSLIQFDPVDSVESVFDSKFLFLDIFKNLKFIFSWNIHIDKKKIFDPVDPVRSSFDPVAACRPSVQPWRQN